MRWLTLVLVVCVTLVTAVHGASVQVVTTSDLAKSAQYGVGKLSEAISSRGIQVVAGTRVVQAESSQLIVAGLAGDRETAAWIKKADLALPEAAESLAIGHIRDGQRDIVVLCGADAVGLMYAALDTAQRIGWATDDDDLLRSCPHRL